MSCIYSCMKNCILTGFQQANDLEGHLRSSKTA